MEEGADLEGMTKEEWELKEVGLGEGSSRTGSPGNGPEMEVEVRFEERRNRDGKMDG